METVMLWVLPLLLLAYLGWQFYKQPKGNRKTYYLILFVTLLLAFLWKNVWQAIR